MFELYLLMSACYYVHHKHIIHEVLIIYWFCNIRASLLTWPCYHLRRSIGSMNITNKSGKRWALYPWYTNLLLNLLEVGLLCMKNNSLLHVFVLYWSTCIMQYPKEWFVASWMVAYPYIFMIVHRSFWCSHHEDVNHQGISAMDVFSGGANYAL